ncbi:MAG: hypothetical protein C0434_12830 [Xanthomonadaceae bacterium]|nr:hypothetical protein [Xanthomonadaceae bacterium]
MTPSAGLPLGALAGSPAGLLAGRALAAGLGWVPKPIDLDRAMMGFQADIARNIAGDRVPWRLAKAFAESHGSEALVETAALERLASASADRWQSAREAMRESRAEKMRRASDESAAAIKLARDALALQTADKGLRLWAAARCAEARGIVEHLPAGGLCAWARLAAYCRAWDIDAAQPCRPRSLPGCAMRMTTPKWWRAVTRKRWAQLREYEAIQSGQVHARAGLYVSREMMEWARRRRSDNREMLAEMVAISDTGDSLPLIEAIDASVSNPAIRCTEMMTRNAGLEFVAECRGDDAIFVTWTLASRYHSHVWRDRFVAENPRYRGASPREGQRRLAELWDGFVRAARRRSIRWYGSRFVQPHHDGCPHWHMLLYVAPDRRAELEALLTEWALTDDAHEPGALERRCVIELIDREKGSAVSYVARYIARAIDGRSLDALSDTDDDGHREETAPADAVERVTAWAYVWGVRLFQFVGTPPVTVWRELRRVREPDPKAAGGAWALERLREAADAGDFGEFIDLMGGPNTPRKLQTARTRRVLDPDRPNCYGEASASRVVGVQLGFEFAAEADAEAVAAIDALVSAAPRRRRRALRRALIREARASVLPASLTTRAKRWSIVRRSDVALSVVAVAVPWTRVNNCPAQQPAGPPDPSRIAA